MNGAEEQSYDRVRKGPFFRKKKDFYVYFHKLHPFYELKGKKKGVTNEAAVGENEKEVGKKEREFLYATRPLKYKGFKFHRDKDGFSPLFVLRDIRGRVLEGDYTPLQSIKKKDGSYLYASGTSAGPGSFPFPQIYMPPVFKLQTTYYPPERVDGAGEVLFQVWPIGARHTMVEGGEMLFKGKAGLGEMVRVGDYYLSMDEVRYWASMKVYYQPGAPLMAVSFWGGLGGIALSTVAKLMRRKK